MTYSTHIGGISESFRDDWTAHTTRPTQWEPDAFDIFTWYNEIPNPDWHNGGRFFTNGIKADWGAWAYRITKERAKAYNECVEEQYRIPEWIIYRMEDGIDYAVVHVEDVHYT